MICNIQWVLRSKISNVFYYVMSNTIFVKINVATYLKSSSKSFVISNWINISQRLYNIIILTSNVKFSYIKSIQNLKDIKKWHFQVSCTSDHLLLLKRKETFKNTFNNKRQHLIRRIMSQKWQQFNIYRDITFLNINLNY